MAEPPQIEDPTPIKVASFVSRSKKRWKKKAIIKAIEIVERMTGSEDCPTAKKMCIRDSLCTDEEYYRPRGCS